MSILGAWHYVYHQLMMLKIGFSMLLDLDTQVWKKRAGSVISNEITVSWNDRLVLRHELLENNEYRFGSSLRLLASLDGPIE